jgi:hypothetical protein
MVFRRKALSNSDSQAPAPSGHRHWQLAIGRALERHSSARLAAQVQTVRLQPRGPCTVTIRTVLNSVHMV